MPAGTTKAHPRTKFENSPTPPVVEKKAFIIISTDEDGLSWVTANFLLLEIAWVVVMV